MTQMNLNQALRNILLVVIVFAVVLMSNAALKWSLSLSPSKTINVNAEGKATVSPDIAKTSFSVVSEGSNPEILQTDNSKKMTAAIDFVKSQGVNEKDIKTTNYSLSPRYEYNETRRQSFITGYTLNQTTLVKIRDLNKVAKIIGGLSELGVNQIGSVSFEVDERDKYLIEARSEAFSKAHQKAAEMASLKGVRIKRVINFSENQNGPPYLPYPYPSFERNVGGLDYISQSPLPTIQPGTEEVTIQVNVTYEIE